MSLLYGQDVPDISITKDGTVYRLPVQQQGSDKTGYRPVPVARSPKLTFPPPIAIAGPEGGQFRRNYDIDELVQVTWEGGMGDDTVSPGTEVRGFQWGQCDSRWPNILTNRPLATQLGSAVSTGSASVPYRVIEVGYASASPLLHGFGTKLYRWTGAAWSAVQSGGVDIDNVTQVAVGMGGLVVWGTVGGGYTPFRSTDATTWTAMATSLTTGSQQVVEFDDKIWALDQTGVGSGSAARTRCTAYSSADLFTAAGGAGTWTAGAQVTVPGYEKPLKLFTWMYPLDRGKATLWLLTGLRLFYYDYYASTPAWREFTRFREFGALTSTTYYDVDAAVMPGSGNLYVGVGGQEWIWEYTGNTIDPRASWNKRHGLPAGTRLSSHTLAANGSGLYVFCGPHPADSGSKGAALYMDEGKNFHHLYDQATNNVNGGGVGANDIWVVAGGASQSIYELDNPDILSVPPNVSGRTFDTAANLVQSGWLRMGLANTNKRLLQFEIDCIKTDGTKGLNTSATVKVEYRGRDSASWTSAGTLTSGSTFPAVLAISGGWTFKEMQYRLTLTAGSSSNPALVRAVKVGYRPRPKQRYTYQVRVDLRDGSPAFMTDDEKYHGRSASFLRGVLDELSDNDDLGLDDTLVALAYGGFGNILHPRRRTCSQAEVSIVAQESPDGGDGLYLLQFNDISSSTSG